MRWTVLNTVGASAWLAGLEYAKGADLPTLAPLGDEHRVLAGILLGLAGLVILGWANFRSAG